MIQKARRLKTGKNIRVKGQSKKRRPAKKIKTTRKRIQSREVFLLTMKEIDTLMKEGEENLSQK